MQSDLHDKDPTGSLTSQVPQTAERVAPEAHAYDEILKSSVLIGGSSIISTVIAIVRTKALALLLGPAGFGLISIYQSIADVTRSVAEMGINNSGVRQIAEAVGSGDSERIARTVTVLRRVSVALGVFGAILLLVFCGPLSTLSFGNEQHVGAVALLSLAVFFRLVADGQGALVQGMRRIADLARMGILGALFGTVVSIPIVYFYREDGVAPFLVCVAAMSAATSWWFSRKVRIQRPSMTVSQIREETASLLKLGVAFMANVFLTMGAAYAARIIVLRDAGLESAGFYQAAITLGSLYCAYVYQGIFADFYPRLVGVAKDNNQCNRLVNDQTHVAMLLAGPGVIGTVTFAPWVVALFYSTEFNAAVTVLRWICLGAVLRVIFQPMGFIIVAKGERMLFFGTELAWAVVNVGMTWFFVDSFGLNGAGIAFFASYVFYGIMMYPVARKLSGFRWSGINTRTSLIFLSLIGATFCGYLVLRPALAASLGALATLASTVYSIRVLLRHVSQDRIPRALRRLLVQLRFIRPDSAK